MTMQSTFVIVGAGLAGATAAETLREEGFTGRVIVLGAESERPYQRPPLSKGYLLGTEDRAAIFVHPADWYAQNSVELRLGSRVTAIDRPRRVVRLPDGEEIAYTKLLLATGSSPRLLPLPGADLDGVLTLRSVHDSERLRHALRAAGRVAIVGAGWIGLEVAAAARTHGCQVTVIEPQSTPLRAALGPQIGGLFADLHRRHGVDLRLGRQVTGLHGEAGRVTAVQIDDGTRVPADTVLVAVGARPDTELAEQARLPVDDGVLADESLRTEDPDIYVAGDLAKIFHPAYRHSIRVEHWATALHTGAAAARAMLGEPTSYDRLPYFFTDQYDLGMEYTGWIPPGGYDTVITRGNPPDGAFQAFWLAGDQVLAGMHVNQWDPGIDPIAELIRTGGPIDRARLADPSVPLTEVSLDTTQA